MKRLKRIRILGAALLVITGVAVSPQRSMAQTSSVCVQTISTDAKAISSDLSAIASQAKAQGFNGAVEQFASDIESILPTLSRPSQEAVQKFVNDLETATSPSSPGGTAITAVERLVLTNDWVVIVTSAGITSAQITTLSDDLTAVLGALRGISTAQLSADFNALVADVEACAARR